MPTIRPATEGDWSSICDYLRNAGLPTADLQATTRPFFLVADGRHGDCLGAIGLECFESLGLLRSLIVDEAARGLGIGRMLVGRLERQAAAAGVQELWLLTIDADRFFAGLGYHSAERNEAPAAIRETAEFSSLCPASAHLMRKSIC